jgi:hypothetical protein
MSLSTLAKRVLMLVRTPCALDTYAAFLSSAARYSSICFLMESRLAEFFSMQVFLQPLSSSVPSQQSVQQSVHRRQTVEGLRRVHDTE